MKLWHASRTSGEIEQFHPFSHFASLDIAIKRTESKVFDNTELSFYVVELQNENALKIQDLNDTYRSNNHSLITLTDFLHYDENVLSSRQRDSVFKYIGSPDLEIQGFTYLGEILKSKGYDSIVYENQWEKTKNNKLSWMNLDSQSVKIIEKLNKDSALSLFNRN